MVLGCLISITVSIITIVSIFYFTRYGLNVKSTIIDIASFSMCIVAWSVNWLSHL